MGEQSGPGFKKRTVALTINDITSDTSASPELVLANDDIGASPIFTHVWPGSDELNAQLRQVVLDRMAVSPGQGGIVTPTATSGSNPVLRNWNAVPTGIVSAVPGRRSISFSVPPW